MTDIEGFLTIYGHSDNLLNNKIYIFGSALQIFSYCLFGGHFEKRGSFSSVLRRF